MNERSVRRRHLLIVAETGGLDRRSLITH